MVKTDEKCCPDTKRAGSSAAGGGIYGLAFIGAMIYFLQNADTFWQGLLGILKAIVWPALLVYKALEFFSM